MAQVLIVGAGVTGSVLAMLVREMGLTVRVLEKSLGAGGRMSTHTFRESPGTRDAPVVGHADLGAQYITTRSSEDHPQLGPIYRRLTDAGVLRAFDGEVAGPNPYGASSSEARPSSSGGAGIVRHFTAPQGLRAVSQHFLEVGQTAGQTLSFGAALEEVSLAPGGTVVLRLAGAEGPLEALAEKAVIVFTQPVPQVLGASKHSLKGNFLQSTDQSVLAGLRKVQYSSRFAMAFSFSSSDFKWPYAWDVSYFEGGHVRYVSHDTAKRGAVEPSASIVVHSGVPLGMELVDEEEPLSRRGWASDEGACGQVARGPLEDGDFNEGPQVALQPGVQRLRRSQARSGLALGSGLRTGCCRGGQRIAAALSLGVLHDPISR